MNDEETKSIAAPPFMGQEIEWAVLIKTEKGKYRLPYLTELQTMINIFRGFLDYPLIGKDNWGGALEQTTGLKSEKEWLDFLKKCSAKARLRDIGILPCGFRYYIDGEHLELSTPGCSSAEDLVISDKAAEKIVNISRSVMEKNFLPAGYEVKVFKDTSNRKGTSFAGHENYLINRDTFEKIWWRIGNAMMLLASFLALRIPLTGAGKSGADNNMPTTFFQISQRADWIERLIGLDTTFSRPLINTRDEPHARYTLVNGEMIPLARLHVICGEPNMSFLSTKIKFGLTSNFLMGLQDGIFDGIQNDIILADPVSAIKIISRDLLCQRTVDLADGRKVKFYEILRVINDRLRWYFENTRKPSAEQMEIIKRVDYYCDCFAKGPKHYLRLLLPELDWINRFDVCSSALGDNYNYRSFDSKTWGHLYYNDLCYADVDPAKSLYYQRERLYKEENIIGEEIENDRISDRVLNPPQNNREYLRGEILRKFPDLIGNWGVIYLPFRGSIYLSDPFRGGFSEIGDIVKKCENVIELLKILGNLSFEVDFPV